MVRGIIAMKSVGMHGNELPAPFARSSSFIRYTPNCLPAAAGVPVIREDTLPLHSKDAEDLLLVSRPDRKKAYFHTN